MVKHIIMYLIPKIYFSKKFDLKKMIKINNLDKNIFKDIKKWKVSGWKIN